MHYFSKLISSCQTDSDIYMIAVYLFIIHYRLSSGILATLYIFFTVNMFICVLIFTTCIFGMHIKIKTKCSDDIEMLVKMVIAALSTDFINFIYLFFATR